MPQETLYREEYGEELIAACRQGYSPTGFAGSKRVSRQVLYGWANRYPEFADALTRAKAARVEWFETQMRNILVEGGTGGQATLLMFLLRNAGPDDYQDRKEITGADGKPLIEDSDPARVAASLLELLKGEGMKMPRPERAVEEVAAGTQEPRRRGRPRNQALSDPREPPEEPDEDEPAPEPELPIEEPEPRPAAKNPPPPWGFV